ncbi:MAG: HAMP domain-containing protein [Desulfurivibrio sp.]|nr:MAG: HAMP domain-containing protein [Desulfurivibrio sp.]
MLFRNAKIAVRIGIMIAIFSLIIVALGIIEFVSMVKIRKGLEMIINETNVEVELAQEMRFLARHKAVIIRNILLLQEQADKEFELTRIEKEESDYALAHAKLAEIVKDAEGRAILARIIKGREETRPLWDQVIELGMANRRDEGIRLLVREVRSRQWGWLDSLNDMVALQKKYAAMNYEKALHTYTTTRNTFIMIDMFSIIIGLFAAVAITRSITRPLADITEKVDRIAHGDLAVHVDYDENNEIGLLSKNINHMVALRKQSEKELEEYRLHLEDLVEERTEALNRQREKFISVLIHDLKGPLTPIQGFTRRLLAGKAKSSDDVERYLQSIEKSAQQLLDTIEATSKDLRDKLSLGVFKPEEVNLTELAVTVAGSFIVALEERGISLTINHAPRGSWDKLDGISITGDRCQLKTMLENLLGNAGKYARQSIEMELGKNNGDIVFAVVDDGPGIAEQYHEKIFEQYFQVPGSRKGTGIGLYSVQKVVENHHGAIGVSSVPGRGARFQVTLPAAAPDAPEHC